MASLSFLKEINTKKKGGGAEGVSCYIEDEGSTWCKSQLNLPHHHKLKHTLQPVVTPQRSLTTVQTDRWRTRLETDTCACRHAHAPDTLLSTQLR